MNVIVDNLGPEALGMALEAAISSGPCTPSTSAGQLSTSVVVISWPPGATPVITTGFRLARAA